MEDAIAIEKGFNERVLKPGFDNEKKEARRWTASVYGWTYKCKFKNGNEISICLSLEGNSEDTIIFRNSDFYATMTFPIDKVEIIGYSLVITWDHVIEKKDENNSSLKSKGEVYLSIDRSSEPKSLKTAV